MAKINLLIQGYARHQGDISESSSSCVLVQDNDISIIVDPGVAREKILQSLLNDGLKPEDIKYVFLTHSHIDHAYGAAWFAHAAVLDNQFIYYDGDKERKHDGFIPDTELAIIQTPGHTLDHCSLMVPTDRGMVAVAGDVFWWPDDEEQKVEVAKDDVYAVDKKLLTESRKKILTMADFIIPGHGRMFRVEKQL